MTTVLALTPPTVRLTSICKENENTGLMRFREETSGDAYITWKAKMAGGSYFQTGEIKLGETAFFDALRGTVIVDWYMTEDTAVSGSTTKAQNETACTVITICLDGVTQEWIENRGIPEGATRGECVVGPTDVCPNIDGVQYNIPDGLHMDGGGINCVSFSQAGPPPQGPYTPPQGQVLGASTGKVLGASTLAGTGSFAENLYLAIMALGGIITFAGIKNFKKAI